MIGNHLSSDILEQQFGPTTVKVLRQDNAVRVIQTVVTKNQQILELSLVRFEPAGIAAFPEVHATIKSGQSMGKAFRAKGIKFLREEEFACYHAVPLAIQKMFDTERPALMVGVSVLVGPSKILYATIVETYTGTVTWPRLFGEATQQAVDELQHVVTYL